MAVQSNVLGCCVNLVVFCPQGADMFGRRRTSGTASDSGFGGYSRDWSDYGNGMYGGAAAPQPTSSGDKRKRSDPRLNCIKSVQYRVSRFPGELHDMCVEHWERTRCARVVCNGVNGVMSVQGGRCVVSFTQHGQEVLKGVADYLRYAGEDRIKKWRRHVRMVGEYLGWLPAPLNVFLADDVSISVSICSMQHHLHSGRMGRGLLSCQLYLIISCCTCFVVQTSLVPTTALVS